MMRICAACRDNGFFNQEFSWVKAPDCHHKMCGKCLRKLPDENGKVKCPECNRPQLRKDYVDLMQVCQKDVEKDNSQRAMVLKHFYRKRRDFDSEDEYNDYLEKIEYIVMTYCHSNLKDSERNKVRQLMEEEKKRNQKELREQMQMNIITMDQQTAEIDWEKIKLPGLIDTDQQPQDLLADDNLNYKNKRASGIRDKDCYNRGTQEILKCLDLFTEE